MIQINRCVSGAGKGPYFDEVFHDLSHMNGHLGACDSLLLLCCTKRVLLLVERSITGPLKAQNRHIISKVYGAVTRRQITSMR